MRLAACCSMGTAALKKPFRKHAHVARHNNSPSSHRTQPPIDAVPAALNQWSTWTASSAPVVFAAEEKAGRGSGRRTNWRPRSSAAGETSSSSKSMVAGVKAAGKSIRRNLSFQRGKKKEPAPAAGDPSPRAAPSQPTTSSAARASSSPGRTRTSSRACGAPFRGSARTSRRRSPRRPCTTRRTAARASSSSRRPYCSCSTRRRRAPSRRRASGCARCTRRCWRAPNPAHFPHASGTHEGGEGGVGKENQDTYFVIHPSTELAVYAVLDGHGKRFGRLASQLASSVWRRY